MGVSLLQRLRWSLTVETWKTIRTALTGAALFGSMFASIGAIGLWISLWDSVHGYAVSFMYAMMGALFWTVTGVCMLLALAFAQRILSPYRPPPKPPRIHSGSV